MDKKYDDIEQLITEGFWDAILNKAKRLGLAAGAALGSEQHRGKLDANTFATDLYNTWKRWQGQTGVEPSVENLGNFLVSQVNMNPQWVGHTLGIQTTAQQSQQSSQQNSGDNDDPLGHIQGGGDPKQSSSNGSSNGSSGSPQEKYEAKEGEFEPQSKALSDFMRYAVYGAFKRTVDKHFDPSVAPATYNPEFDGSFVYSKEEGEDGNLRELMKKIHGCKPEELDGLVAELRKGHYFDTWDNFKKLVPGGDRIGKGTDVEADLFRQSLSAGRDAYGYNFPKELRRFVIARPQIPADTSAAINLPVKDGDPNARAAKQQPGTQQPQTATNGANESFDLEGVHLMEKGVSDATLRKFFLQIAQKSLRDGQFRLAANNTIDQIRAGSGPVSNALPFGDGGGNGGGNGGNGGGQQQSAGSDTLQKAAHLGQKLGIRLDKFALTDFKKANGNDYREFIKFLNQENAPNFDQGFLDYSRKTLSKYLDMNELKQAAQQGNQDAQGGEDGKDQGQAGGEQSQQQDEGMKYYDIDHRQVGWDPKTETLHVKSTNPGGKASERIFKRSENGWLFNLRPVPKDTVTQLDNMYDQVMQQSGGEAAKDAEDPADPNSIPSGATVTPPPKDGQAQGKYTFDGKSWRNENGAAVTSEKSVEFLNNLYRNKGGEQQNAEQPAGNNGEAQQSNDTQQSEVEVPDNAVVTNAKGTRFTYNDKRKEWFNASQDLDYPKGSKEAQELDRIYDKPQQGESSSKGQKPYDPKDEKPQAQQTQNQQSQGQAKPAANDASQQATTAPVSDKAPPTDARLSHNGKTARKMTNGKWWDENEKKYYDDAKTAQLDQAYNKAFAANDKSAIPPSGAQLKPGSPQAAQTGTTFKAPSGVVYKKDGNHWVNTATNKVADDKMTHYLDRESGKQNQASQNKQERQAAQQAQNDKNADADERDVPQNATFTVPGTKRVLQRKPNGWMENGKLIDNPSQVDTFDRGWREQAKRNRAA
jgi:hypothetical protein